MVLAVSAVLAISSAAIAPAIASDQADVPTATAGVDVDAADRARDAAADKGPRIALYKGERIDLSKGWQGAQVCTEYADLSMECFDTDAEAIEGIARFEARNPQHKIPEPPPGRGDMLLGPEGVVVVPDAAEARKALAAGGEVQTVAGEMPASCGYAWACVYADINYGGRKLQWTDAGTKTLGQHGFRDQASSTANNKKIGGFAIIDYRDNMVDPESYTQLGSMHPNLRNVDYPGIGTGDWNDRADAVRL